MSIPEESSHGLISLEKRQNTRIGCSRRTFLLGGVSVGGAIAALAGRGWWLHAQSLQPPVVVPADKHRILSFPLSGYSAPFPYQSLSGVEYAWLPDSMHLAVAVPDKIFLINVRTGQTVWQQPRFLKKEQDAVLLINWSTDGKQIQAIQENGVPGGQIAWPTPSQAYNPFVWNSREFAFSADRTYLAFIRPDQDSDVQIWNIPQRSLAALYQDLEVTRGNPLGEVALSWSPTSPSLAIYTNWRQPEIHLWQAEEKRLLWTTDLSMLGGQPASVGQGKIKWSSDGLALAYTYTSDLPYIGVLDARAGAIRFQTTMAPSSPEVTGEAFAWSPDGARLAFFANEQNKPPLQVWQAQTGRHLFTCQHVQGSVGLVLGGVGHPDIGEPGIVSWSPDGRYLVARTLPENNPSQATLQFWDAHTGQALFSYHAPYDDGFMSWSPHLLWSLDSHFLAAYMVTNANCTVPIGFPGHPRCSYTFALQVFQVE